MNGKIMKKTLISCVAALLIIALAIALVSFLNNSDTADAAQNILKATYVGNHGQLSDVEGGHRTDAQEEQYLQAKYGGGSILKITTGQQLYEFINSETSYSYAYLANDVGIAYSNNNIEEYYYMVSNSSSNAIFTKVLDGNGYKVSLWGGTGSTNYRELSDNYFSFGSTTYRYTGLLMAVNRGTIENLTVDYSSNHGTIVANTGGIDKGLGFTTMDYDTNTGLFTDNGSTGTGAGIVTGLNDDKGVIDNVRVNITSPFKVVDWCDSNNGDMNKNFAFVGGIVGRAGNGSMLKNSQIDIDENAGIYCGVEGYPIGSTKQGKGLAVAGGLVGKIDKGVMDTTSQAMKNACVEYCAVTGAGTIKGFVARARVGNIGNDGGGYRAYTGGAIGGCFNITSDQKNGALQDGGKNSTPNHSINKGQINGIISTWTGVSQNNYENQKNISYGQLFGSVGQDVVQSIAVLYDLIGLRSDLGVDVTNADNTSIDAYNSNVISKWVGIYPKTEGGEVLVRLIGDATSDYDMRIHAFANGSDMNDEALLAEDLGDTDGKKYAFSEGQTGNIIWKANLDDKILIDLEKTMPIYAESKLITSRANGNYEYSFGSITTITFENTNGNSLSRGYEGKNAVLSKPRVVAESGITVEDYEDDEWTILRDGVRTTISGTALPGFYSMNVTAKEKTYVDMGYYSEDQRVAAWKSSSDYLFKITSGVLNYGSNTKISPSWDAEARFELTMASRDDFDTVRYVLGGQVIMESASEFVKNNNSATITIRESTGKNGTAYSFIAYVNDNGTDIPVAETKEAMTVKIDKEEPEVSEITYYVRNSAGKETKISESDLSTWRKDRVVAEYTVNDTKSGIRYADSMIAGADIVNRRQADGSYKVRVTLSRNEPVDIKYTDEIGNSKTVTLQANVDYMLATPTLALASVWYPYRSSYGYSTDGARIRFNPTVGCSDWLLQYSWEKDENGKDKWEDAMAEGSHTEKYRIQGTTQQSFLIDWNIYDPVKKIGADFKLRMVNVQGLYGDAKDHAVYLSDDGKVTDNGFVGSFVINYKVASIYVDNSLKAVKVRSGDRFNGKSLYEIINSEDKDDFFNKTYDGSDLYNKRGNTTFYIDVKYLAADRQNINEYVKNGVGVLYSPAYIAYQRDVDEQIEVKLRYESANVRECNNLIATFDTVLEKYDLYFADNAKIDFTNAYKTIDEELFSSACAIKNVKIEPVEVEGGKIYLAGVDELSEPLKYGDKIPSTVEVFIGIKNQPIVIQLDCKAANSICPVSEEGYVCTGKIISDLGGNIKEPEIVGTQIIIEPKPVSVDIKMDGKDDLPQSAKAGQSHTVTATYTLIDGKTKRNADVELDMGDGAPVKNASIYKLGRYKITISIKDPNYCVKDTYRDENGRVVDDEKYVFYFSILQGQLALKMGINEVEYKGGEKIAYNPGVPTLAEGLFQDSDLSYTYYPYFIGADYDATTKKIKGEWDRKSAFEGDESPREIGLYHVVVTYKGNDAFFADTYEGDIVVGKATTVMELKTKLSYAYDWDGNGKAIARCFDLKAAEVIVKSADGKNRLWHYNNTDDINSNLVTVKYRNTSTGEWEDVGDSSSSGGWYDKVGRQSYKVVFAGTDNYKPCETTVELAITKAEFKGIKFEDVKDTVVFNGDNFVSKFDPFIPDDYKGAAVKYRYANKTYTSLKEIVITDAGTHKIYMTVSDPEFVDFHAEATITIERAKIVGVTAIPASATYDGKPHYVTFNGLRVDENGDYRYDGYKVVVGSATNFELGNVYAVEAGTYRGKVRLSIDNYDSLVLDTYIQIDKAEIKVDSAKIDLPSQLPSGMDVSNYFGSYTQNGEVTDCYLVYRDANTKEIVTPDSNGVLPDGEYKVELDVGDNHMISMNWDFVVGEINSKTLSAWAIVAVVVVVAVMVAAVVTSVVVVNKRKKADSEIIA